VKSYSVAVIESGPLLVRLEATYALNRRSIRMDRGTRSQRGIRWRNVALAGDLYYWNAIDFMQFRATVERFRAGWRRTSSVLAGEPDIRPGCGQTISRCATRKADRRWTSPARRRQAVRAGDDEPGGQGYFKGDDIDLRRAQVDVIEDDTDAQLQYFLNTYGRKLCAGPGALPRHGRAILIAATRSQERRRFRTCRIRTRFWISPTARRTIRATSARSSIKFAPVWYMANSGATRVVLGILRFGGFRFFSADRLLHWQDVAVT